MFTAIANTSALHALRLAFAVEFATDCLDGDGFFELGKFLEEYEDTAPLLSASKEERAALYEPALLALEAAHGPLFAVYGDEQLHANTWGYAGLYHEVDYEEGTQHSELLTQRISALGTGHPDQKAWNSGKIPGAVWKREDRLIG